MTKKKGTGAARPTQASQQAAHVAAFIESPKTPMIFQTVLYVFLAHAANATGISVVGGKDCNTISLPRLAQLIKRAEGLGYDEGGLYREDGTGSYLIETESKQDDGAQHDRDDEKRDTPLTLEARAEAIIDGRTKYDVDTRAAVQLALRNYRFNRDGDKSVRRPPQDAATVEKYERGLRGLCQRAESGESLSDLAGIKPESVEVARAVLAVFEMEAGMPDFLLNALMTMLNTVEGHTGLRIWISTDEEDEDDGDLSLRALALACEQFAAASIQFAPKLDLAGHVAAVMDDEATPVELFNAMQEVLGDMVVDSAVSHAPEVLRVALAANRPGA